MSAFLLRTVTLFCGLVLAGLPLIAEAQQHPPDEVDVLSMDVVEGFLPDQLGNATLETLIEEDLLKGGRYQDDAYDTPLKFGFLHGSAVDDALQTLQNIQIEAVMNADDWSSELWPGIFADTGDEFLEHENVHYVSTGSFDAPDMALALVDQFLVVGLVDGSDSAERLRNAFEAFDFTTINNWMPRENFTIHSVHYTACLSIACMMERLEQGGEAIFRGRTEGTPSGSIFLGTPGENGRTPVYLQVSGLNSSLNGKMLNLEISPESAQDGFEAAFLTPFAECIESTAPEAYNCHGELMEALNE